MPLKLIEKIKRHASMASGNFERIFEGTEIPPLPAAISQLVVEIGKDEPDFSRISTMIASLPDIAIKVLQTVNSAYYSLPNPVSSVMHAVTVLGLNIIRPLILSFAMKETLPTPPGNLFKQDAFWSDSLIKSLFARAFADLHCRSDREEAFTSMLLADIALPVLLTNWGEYYQPIAEQWQTSQSRLSILERKNFQWDHAQAGAWILQNWKFPVELVCFVGLHNTSVKKIEELELIDSIALPVTIAAHAPSVLRPDTDRADKIINMAIQHFSLDHDKMLSLIMETHEGYREISKLFGLSSSSGDTIFELLKEPLVEKDNQYE